MRVNEQSVMTVLGEVDPTSLGITMTHEHLFADMRYAYSDTSDLTPGPELTMDRLGEARRDFARFPDVAVLNDYEVTVDEVRSYSDLGGATIVDVTSQGFYSLGKGQTPDVDALQRLAKESGLNIVRGCGFYVDSSHSDRVRDASMEQLRDTLIDEILHGWGDTGIRPGVIGETGLSQPVTRQEWKTLEASCEAQKATGLPLYIHPHFGVQSRVAPEAIRFVLNHGVDPSKVNACHMDECDSLEVIRRVLDMGVYVSLDTFGLELYFDSLAYNHARHDSQRVELLLQLLDWGYGDQLLVSQDVCTKLQLRKYGGYGYGHFLGNIVPWLRNLGLEDVAISRLYVENAQTLLSVPSTR